MAHPHRQIRRHHPMLPPMRSHGSHDSQADDKWTDFFIYSTDPVGFSLTTGQISNRVIQIDADSDFNLMRVTGYAEAAGGTFPQSDGLLPQITVNLADGMTSRNLFNNPVPWGNFIGTSKLPFVMPQYRMLKKNGTIIIGLSNYSAVTYNNIVVALHGVKVFDFKG